MTKFELGWVAGILEGEGCFIARQGKSKKRFYLAVDVQSADLDVIEKLIRYTGLGSVGGPYKTRAKHHSPMYGWKLSSQPARLVMEAVLPYMCKRRQRKIEECLARASL